MLSRLLPICLLLILSGCRLPWDTCDVQTETEVRLKFEHSGYAPFSVVATHGMETDTIRIQPYTTTTHEFVGGLGLGKSDTVGIRALWGDSLLFERQYITPDTSGHQISFLTDTTQCQTGSREVFQLPGGFPLLVCFTHFTSFCID